MQWLTVFLIAALAAPALSYSVGDVGEVSDHIRYERSVDEEGQAVEELQVVEEEEDLMESLSCDSDLCQDAQQWSAVLFDDLLDLPVTNSPSAVLAFGERAFPVVKDGGLERAFIVAAELGEGRVVVNSVPKADVHRFDDHQDGFTSRYENKLVWAHFSRNVKQWLTGGNFVDGQSQICMITQASDMACLDSPDARVAAVDVKYKWDSTNYDDDLLDFVSRGNGLYYGGQFRVNTANVADLPFISVINEAGIAATKSNIRGASDPASLRDEEGQFLLNDESNLCLLAGQVSSVNQLPQRKPLLSLYLAQLKEPIMDEKYKRVVADVLKQLLDPLDAQVTWPSGSVHKVVKTPVSSGQMQYLLLAPQLANLGLTGDWLSPAPNAQHHPGLVGSSERVEQEVVLQGAGSEWLSTGMYLAPGEEATLTVTSPGDGSWGDFQVQVGAHSDNLHKKTVLYRSPFIRTRVSVSGLVTKLRNVHGGLIFLKGPDGASIAASLSGVARAPYFDLAKQETIDAWDTNRHLDAPWADINGRWSRITTPSYGIRDVSADTMVEAMTFWDDVLQSDYDLGGRPDSPEQRPKSWKGLDIQISVGAAHSGYPIGANAKLGNPENSKFLFDVNNGEGFWGMFHELGHNTDKSYYIFDKVGEVTCNIFSLYQMVNKVGQPLWAPEWLRTKFEWEKNSRYAQWLESGAFADLSAGVTLIPYGMLARDFGFDCFYTTFKSYEDDRLAGISMPTQDQAKRNEFMVRFSTYANYNIAPLFVFFDFAIDASVDEDLADLPLYFPAGDILQYELKYPDKISTHPEVLEGLNSRRQVVLDRYGIEPQSFEPSAREDHCLAMPSRTRSLRHAKKSEDTSRLLQLLREVLEE